MALLLRGSLAGQGEGEPIMGSMEGWQRLRSEDKLCGHQGLWRSSDGRADFGGDPDGHGRAAALHERRGRGKIMEVQSRSWQKNHRIPLKKTIGPDKAENIPPTCDARRYFQGASQWQYRWRRCSPDIATLEGEELRLPDQPETGGRDGSSRTFSLNKEGKTLYLEAAWRNMGCNECERDCKDRVRTQGSTRVRLPGRGSSPGNLCLWIPQNQLWRHKGGV